MPGDLAEAGRSTLVDSETAGALPEPASVRATIVEPERGALEAPPGRTTLVFPTTAEDLAPDSPRSTMVETVAEVALFQEEVGPPLSITDVFVPPRGATPPPDRGGAPQRPCHSQAAAFSRALMSQHFEEMVFLFAQATADPFAPGRWWTDGEAPERRLLTHTEALRCHGEAALEMLLDGMGADAPDTLAAAVFGAIAVGGERAVPHVARRLVDVAKMPELRHAVVAALSRAPCPHLTAGLAPLFGHEVPEVREAAVRVAAVRADISDAALSELLVSNPTPAMLARLSNDLTRRPASERVAVAQRLLADSDPVCRRAGLIGLLRAWGAAGAYRFDALIEDAPLPEPWMVSLRAHCCGRHAVAWFERLVQEDALAVAALRALGELGNLGAIDVLISALERDRQRVRAAAGAALEMLTGAGLTPDADHVADTPLRRDAGEAAARTRSDPGSGRSGGDLGASFPERVCTSRAAWEAWWAAHRHRFAINRRYRRGELFRFDQCMDALAADETPAGERIAAHRALTLRAGAEVPWHVRWPVERQRQSITALWHWWHAHGSRFSPGEWYLAGEWID